MKLFFALFLTFSTFLSAYAENVGCSDPSFAAESRVLNFDPPPPPPDNPNPPPPPPPPDVVVI